VVDLRDGRDGFDFLGWRFRARVSGRLLERGIRRYYLHRWPSAPSNEAHPPEGQRPHRPQPRRSQGNQSHHRWAEPDPAPAGATTFGPATPPPSSSSSTATSRGGSSAGLSSARAATCVPERPKAGLLPGLWPRPAPADGQDPLPRGRVSHARKIIGKPCAGKPHARN
jgi:hypothetical protein